MVAFCTSLECWQLAEESSKLCKDHAQGGQHRLDLSGLGNVQLQQRTAPSDDFSKAVALTQTAINNLGGPIHASMIDHKPVDIALAQALTQNAIAHQGERHVDSDKLPIDRAIAEALTLTAISHQPQDKLKNTGRRGSQELEGGLTTEQQNALLEAAKAERDRKAAAKVFGGGDSKEAMASILGEINSQGIIAVPANKVPDQNLALNQIRTLAQINALQGNASNLTHKDAPVDQSIIQARTLHALSSESAKANLAHTETSASDFPLAHGKVLYAIDHLGEHQLKPVEQSKTTDASLAHGQTMYALGHQRRQSLPLENVYTDHALNEALRLQALGSESSKSNLKSVEHPQEGGLTKEKIAALQAAAQQEKSAEGDAEVTSVQFHLPK